MTFHTMITTQNSGLLQLAFNGFSPLFLRCIPVYVFRQLLIVTRKRLSENENITLENAHSENTTSILLHLEKSKIGIK